MNSVKSLCAACAALLLAGCAGSVPKQALYTIDPLALEGQEAGPVLAVKVQLDSVSAREAYKGRGLVASPAPYRLTERSGAQWAESAPAMVAGAACSYLAPRFAMVLPPAWKGKGEADATLMIYLDALTQVKRGGDWLAVLRLSYQVLPRGGGAPWAAGRFDKAMPLEGGDLDLYAAAQSALLKEWLDRLVQEIGER